MAGIDEEHEQHLSDERRRERLRPQHLQTLHDQQEEQHQQHHHQQHQQAISASAPHAGSPELIGGKRSSRPSLSAGQKQLQHQQHHQHYHQQQQQALSTPPARNALPSELSGKLSARPSLPSEQKQQHHHHLQQSPLQGQHHEREEGETGEMDPPAAAAVPDKPVEGIFGDKAVIDAFERAMEKSMKNAEDTKNSLSRMIPRVIRNQVRAVQYWPCDKNP